jgi:ABC-2 type transport system ATP-binding protein
VPAVEVIGLTKQFARRQGRRRVRVTALDGVSFTIARGECVAVLGCNGSGKSTLVRVLSTLLLHDGGSARVFGHDVVHDERKVRGVVNRVSVEAAFFKRLSAD